MCNETGGLGEQLCTDCCKTKENPNFQSEKFSEKLKNCQIVNGQFRHKFSVEKLSQNCINCLKLQSLFQTGTKITNGFSKPGTKWPELDNSRMTNRKTPSKMKGKVKTQLRKINSKMKGNLGTNWPELIQGKKTDKKGFFKTKEGLPLPKAKQIPFKLKRKIVRASESKVAFKMKRKNEIVKFRKTNVKMKVMSKQVKFGKPKWKIKLEI
jgi:hypothetical protein